MTANPDILAARDKVQAAELLICEAVAILRGGHPQTADELAREQTMLRVHVGLLTHLSDPPTIPGIEQASECRMLRQAQGVEAAE